MNLQKQGDKGSDFLIAGGGIVGLTLAAELVARKSGTVTVADREPWLGRHASGRNSGVLHAGIYYGTDSLKARLCLEGNRRLRDWMQEQEIPFRACGKLIVCAQDQHASLEQLHKQALANHVIVALWDEADLCRAAPALRTSERALWSPATAVFDPLTVVRRLRRQLQERGVRFLPDSEVIAFDGRSQNATLRQEGNTVSWPCGHLINAAGMRADLLARTQGVGRRYRMLPFRGSYGRLAPHLQNKVPFCVYPVPDPALPFLGVHLTPTPSGTILVGPNALPALGREHYAGLHGIAPVDALAASRALLVLLAGNKKGLRHHVPLELQRRYGHRALHELQQMLPAARQGDILPTGRVGLRAQLYDTRKHQLMEDFVIEQGENSTHILNAVSPAFTSSFAFARHVCREAGF